MFHSLPMLLAQTASSDAISSVAKLARYQFALLQSFTEWWQMPLLVLVCVALMAFVVLMYRRDSVELRRGHRDFARGLAA